MHILVREKISLDEADQAVDLGQSPADMVFLSFSDSDLGAMSNAWQRAKSRPEMPSLRIANLNQLRHPLSVDLYVEQVVSAARLVVIRLLGGADYWRYGAEQVNNICRQRNIKLAFLPGDGRDDPRLAALSTLDVQQHALIAEYFNQGGPDNIGSALQCMGQLAQDMPVSAAPPRPLALYGHYPVAQPDLDVAEARLVICFYRSHLLSGDVQPIEALANALSARGIAVQALYVTSLKDPSCAEFVRQELADTAPSLVVSFMGFSARMGNAKSPLEAAGVPVLQAMLAGSEKSAWVESDRGLSGTDLAMQLILPELDGRISATAVSFKQSDDSVDELEHAPIRNHADDGQIALTVQRIIGWINLQNTRPADRQVAVILSNYPGEDHGQLAHAVGLDAIASAVHITQLLADASYDIPAIPSQTELLAALEVNRPLLSLDAYRQLFQHLPKTLQNAVLGAWGAPEQDMAICDGHFCWPLLEVGAAIIALQPNRGTDVNRKADYHDIAQPPQHNYIAFYLWLQKIRTIDAMVHLGTHGTLEWLPGKAAALSAACFPCALTGSVPVIYPFIVNNPGEAAMAKRRLGAVTLGHLTPPLTEAGLYGDAAHLEKMIDEYAEADGLDRRRGNVLRRDILTHADNLGLLAESGADKVVGEDEAVAQLDAYLCDVKNLQIRDGLHIFAQSPAPEPRQKLVAQLAKNAGSDDHAGIDEKIEQAVIGERHSLLRALDGLFVEPGPAGAPSRGRLDVLPTGRNLFTTDPRAIPTAAAGRLAEKAMELLLKRHLQEQGEWPRNMVIDLWGSRSIRTGGEDFALALLLMGARPCRDVQSGRVNGVETLSLAELGRPRVDVTLRISGLFRDGFSQQIALFEQAAAIIAALAEDAEDNPLAANLQGLTGERRNIAMQRIFGPAPGSYGSPLAHRLASGEWETNADLGADYISSAAYAYGAHSNGQHNEAGFSARVQQADALIHVQDHQEIDILEGADFAAHEGGFAAAAQSFGASPQLYHIDSANHSEPRVAHVAEEVARIVRGRAANPRWISGMMRHGYRGAAEIARSVDGLFAYAAMLPTRFDRQFDLLCAATLEDDNVRNFLMKENPKACQAMRNKFAEATQRGLWHPRRNIHALAGEGAE